MRLSTSTRKSWLISELLVRARKGFCVSSNARKVSWENCMESFASIKRRQTIFGKNLKGSSLNWNQPQKSFLIYSTSKIWRNEHVLIWSLELCVVPLNIRWFSLILSRLALRQVRRKTEKTLTNVSASPLTLPPTPTSWLTLARLRTGILRTTSLSRETWSTAEWQSSLSPLARLGMGRSPPERETVPSLFLKSVLLCAPETSQMLLKSFIFSEDIIWQKYR